MQKGRNCSLEYILDKNWTEKEIKIDNKVIYIVGGLYGNFFALKKIKELSKKENNPLLIFNGDIHWFDVNEEDFLKIENLIKDDIKLLGNVEFELLRKGDTLGCGCNYPSCTSKEVVERSNIIHSIMKKNLKDANIKKDILKREKTLTLRVFNKKIAITHGDEKNMSGWDCSIDNLKDKKRVLDLANWLEKNKVDILATTHTCLPVVKKINNSYIFNNGSSGIANFKNSYYGLFTRIAKTNHKEAIITKKIGDIYIELVKVEYDLNSFIKWFKNVWKEDSPASVSYFKRIINGTNLDIEEIEK